MLGLSMGIGIGQQQVVVSGGAAAWDPSAAATARSFIWDLQDATTLFQSGTRGAPGTAVTTLNDPIGLILDKSSDHNDLLQSSTARPTYQPNSGKPYAQLTAASSQFMETAAAATLYDGSGQYTVGFMVYVDTNADVFIFASDDGTTNRIGILSRVTGAINGTSFDTTGGSELDVGPAIAITTALRVVMVVSTAGVETFVNAVSNGLTVWSGGETPNITKTAKLTLGGTGNHSGSWFPGRIARGAGFKGVLSAGDFTSFDTWLAAGL